MSQSDNIVRARSSRNRGARPGTTQRLALLRSGGEEMQNGTGREVVIVEAVRTPIGRGHLEKGYYKSTHPNELLGTTFVEVIKRAGIPAEDVEDVICGCVQQ